MAIIFSHDVFRLGKKLYSQGRRLKLGWGGGHFCPKGYRNYQNVNCRDNILKNANGLGTVVEK